ncbi:MAG: DUF1707 domain-containing protein [Propionibacteriaceae bacterium]|jgi:hypothetical protein|nr:DUF1707 domain-containing protein [Propionibacteriaceae bacterium]
MTAEPTDVGPLYGGDRPILESDRELVITLLGAARTDKRLSDPDYALRMSLVYAARTFDDLVPITRDLMA